MAIKSFKDDAAADLFNGLNTKAARRIPNELWKNARRKLVMLDQAATTLDLNAPGLNTEPLKHTMPGFFSIRVNLVYRIMFRFENGNAYDVHIGIDHGRKTS